MELHHPFPDVAARGAALGGVAEREALRRVATLLLGLRDAELPPLSDLIGAAVALATGRRPKVLLPLGSTPYELALVRREASVLASYYETGAAPEVMVLDRRVSLRALLDACAEAAESLPQGAEVLRRLGGHARETELDGATAGAGSVVCRRGGAIEDPGDAVPLAFGFTAAIRPACSSIADGTASADVHALLFRGELWAWVHGRRMPLARGPIMLPVQRMVAAVRALVEAWRAGRPANVRLRAGDFRIGVRLERSHEASVTLGGARGACTVPALDVPGIAFPILRAATDVLRALVGSDRSQTRNLRVRALRSEVRELRRTIRGLDRKDGFVNQDPDRLRRSASVESVRPLCPATAHRVGPRFAERWRLELDEIDATSTFLCGDRLVLSTPRHAAALSREDGSVLWARPGLGGPTMMAGTTLLRFAPEGRVELCDVADGEARAVGKVAPRGGGSVVGLHASGGGAPPVAVLAEGARSLVALDLRNAEPRWRFKVPGAGGFGLRRSGRVLLVASGNGCIDALDLTTGEVVWRFAERERFEHAPAVCGEVVVCVAGDAASRRSGVYGIDLYSGALLWRRELDAGPAAPPIAAGDGAVVAMGGRRKSPLALFDAATGAPTWTVTDPGIGIGGASLVVDGALVVSAPGGRVTALDLADGSERWRRVLSDPLADDVPRRLEPVLRGGALFVPATQVHVLRPSDGASLGSALPCDLVPDLLRVDERGWVYVAEESGVISALAPVPHLSLVRGGS